jgi:hypothetical protein
MCKFKRYFYPTSGYFKGKKHLATWYQKPEPFKATNID